MQTDYNHAFYLFVRISGLVMTTYNGYEDHSKCKYQKMDIMISMGYTKY